MNRTTIRFYLVLVFGVSGCGTDDPPETVVPEPVPETSAALETQVTEPAPPAVATSTDVSQELAAEVTICEVPDPANPSSAFDLFKSEPNDWGDHYVQYSCKQACDDWDQCTVPAYTNDGGELIMQGRDPDQPKQALAFVVDQMAGHLVLTPDGEKTVFIHTGAGGTDYGYAAPARDLENRLAVRTVMVRWEKGFVSPVFEPPFPSPVNWGWYSRTSPDATNIYELNRRVASIISWVHDNLAGEEVFATASCSMGSNATFLAVLWHGIDPIIDYQLLVGGPNNWDLNTHCDRRKYSVGHCDADGVTECETDNQCTQLAEWSRCRMPGTYSHFGVNYSVFANHVHTTEACDYSLTGDLEAYTPFDESGAAFRSEADWEIDHKIDLIANINKEPGPAGPGGDEYVSLGEFTSFFSQMKPDENKQWHTIQNTDHCDAWPSGAAVDLLVERLSEI